MNFVSGYAMALDLTLRDKQNLAKTAGLPWALAKGFDHSCPVSVFVPAEYVPDINDLKITFRLNDQIKQQASTAQMLFSVGKLISYISLYFTLNPGDLILTGTPAGVGSLTPGDQFEASITRIGSVKSQII
jgi:2-keto-4-pentenoate hydratase/2-oxohepta-3-ene-1,7-dioic acid hydratase in catechol pathway